MADQLVVSAIAIFTTATGAHVTNAPAGAKLRDGQSSVALPAGYSDETFGWNATTRMMVEIPSKVQASLIAKVKAKNEDLVRSIYSTNFGKQKKYSRKQQEILDFRALSGALGVVVPNALTAPLSSFLPGLANLSANQQKKKFRYVMAEAKLRGVSVDIVVGEIEERIDVDEDRIAAWEAVEQAGIRAIKAATTATAKRAAYDAINWNFSM
jgi:hypothetical protein